MTGRRGFLGAAGALVCSPRRLAAQEQAKTKGKAEAKTPSNASKLAAPPDEAPPRADEQLNRVLAPVRDAHRLPGLIAAVVRGDRLSAVGAVGLRKIGSVEPITVNDRVHLGSCTKAMTATLVGTVVDEGKLSWSSTLGEVFPGHAKAMHPDFRVTTLAHLLTHRAGLPHDAPWWELGRGRTTTEQRREILPRMLSRAPDSQPGEVYAYSNVGYALAGLMAEQVTNRPWERLMRERLFGPLGMASAGFGPPGKPGRVDEPWGHREREGQIQPTREDNAPSLGPAGTVHVSVPDWGKFVALHLRAAQGKPRLLERSTFRTLHTPPPGREYAGGWYLVDRSQAGGRALMHKGSNLAWYSCVWVYPANDLAVLVATNQGGDPADGACNDATDAILKYDGFRRPGSGRRAASRRR